MKADIGSQEMNIKNDQGFSFIEIMVVVVILGLLAGMIVPRYMGKTDEAKTIKAKVDIAAIETGLRMYKLDNGEYPTTEQGLRALVEKPVTEPIPLKYNDRGYLEKNKTPTDPWGREYRDLSPGVHDDYDIISYGADGVPGGEGKDKDIKSWELD